MDFQRQFQISFPAASLEPSRLTDIIAAHVENRTKPTSADVYDYFAMPHADGVQNDPVKHWGRSE